MKKTLFAMIALAFTIVITSSLVVLPVTNAFDHDMKKATYAVCGVMPSTVGVGQEVLVWLGVTDMLRLYHHVGKA